jgi:adenosine/AMP kinase
VEREDLEISVVDLGSRDGVNIILAQSHFIKTAEDVYEVLKTAVPGMKFGIAFNEASGPKLVRTEGNDGPLVSLAAENAMKVGAGHLLVIAIEDAFPINILNALKNVSEITHIYCATSNKLRVVVCSDGMARSVLGVMDGEMPERVEGEKEKQERREFLRRIGYKL